MSEAQNSTITLYGTVRDNIQTMNSTITLYSTIRDTVQTMTSRGSLLLFIDIIIQYAELRIKSESMKKFPPMLHGCIWNEALWS